MDNNFLKKSLYGVVAVLVLLLLILTAVRLLLTDAFVNIEYRMPNFPDDGYGFSQADRLRWAPIALDYLLNDADISFLGDLTFEDGTPVYNDRELRHMLDVKILTQQFLIVWYISLGAFIIIGGWAWFGGWWKDYRMMLSRGGMFTVVILGTMVFFIFLNFRQLFTNFHRVFFEGDTWLFEFSDTLIRLFPLRFWQDAFIFVGIFAFLIGGALWRFAPARNLPTGD